MHDNDPTADLPGWEDGGGPDLLDVAQALERLQEVELHCHVEGTMRLGQRLASPAR